MFVCSLWNRVRYDRAMSSFHQATTTAGSNTSKGRQSKHRTNKEKRTVSSLGTTKHGSGPREVLLSSNTNTTEWKVGDRCRAIWTEDEQVWVYVTLVVSTHLLSPTVNLCLRLALIIT